MSMPIVATAELDLLDMAVPPASHAGRVGARPDHSITANPERRNALRIFHSPAAIFASARRFQLAWHADHTLSN
jgi:hypothetical protein